MSTPEEAGSESTSRRDRSEEPNPYASPTTPAQVGLERPAPSSAPSRSLSLFDSTSIVVGVIIGATIYESSPTIARSVPNMGALVGVWLAGGLIALLGALCYAELATAYPQSGGGYVYLGRAFGRRMGALYAWAELCVVRCGSIGAMSFVFARYANKLAPLGDGPLPLLAYAAMAIIGLTLLNLAGVQEGKWTQNVLTTAKVLGLLMIFGVAMAWPSDGAPAVTLTTGKNDFALAFILIMFAYGGWNEVSFVAAEVRDPRRNIPRTLLLGVGVVTAVYILANVAFNVALGWEDFRASDAVAADVLRLRFGERGARLISALVCVTTLGAVNGQIFAGARIYYAFGRDHRWYAVLGRWNARRNVPSWALVVQGLVCLAPVVAFGVSEKAFDRMVVFTTPVFWFFFLLVGTSLILLRRQPTDAPAPFRVPLYPLTPLLFIASSLLMLYATFEYAIKNGSAEAGWAIAILILGYLLSLAEEKLSLARY